MGKIDFKKIQKKIEQIVGILAEKSFLTSICLMALAIFCAGILFYKYNILVNEAQISPSGQSLELESKSYQNMLDEWQARQTNFDNANLKNFLDPFATSSPLTG